MTQQTTNDQADTQRTRSFNPNEHLLKLKSKDGLKDYLPVQWRLVWFREQCPGGTIDTEEIVVDLDRECELEVNQWNNETRRSEKVMKRARGYARFRAVVTDGKGARATGTKSESAVNFADYIEKSETGAIGRALAALGYGTQFTGDEFEEGERLADAPVDRPAAAADTAASNGQTTKETVDSAPATDQQLASIKKLCQHLNKIVEQPTTYGAASLLLKSLSAEYNNKRKAS